MHQVLRADYFILSWEAQYLRHILREFQISYRQTLGRPYSYHLVNLSALVVSLLSELLMTFAPWKSLWLNKALYWRLRHILDQDLLISHETNSRTHFKWLWLAHGRDFGISLGLDFSGALLWSLNCVASIIAAISQPFIIAFAPQQAPFIINCFC